MTVGGRDHWDGVYKRREPDRLSWFEAEPAISLELIAEAGLDREAGIVDIGGGASGLAAALIRAEYRDLTVVDISATALERSRGRSPTTSQG